MHPDSFWFFVLLFYSLFPTFPPPSPPPLPLVIVVENEKKTPSLRPEIVRALTELFLVVENLAKVPRVPVLMWMFEVLLDVY